MAMAKAQRDKGYRVENNLVKKHAELGVFAQRVPLSGGAGGQFSGDLKLDIPGMGTLLAEVKARGKAEGWKSVKDWLGPNDLLFLVEDRKQPLVVLPWSTYQDILAALGATHGDGSDESLEEFDAEFEEYIHDCYGDSDDPDEAE
jgi:hypothetical protein